VEIGTASSGDVITVEGLSKSFGGHEALKDVSFRIGPGYVTGLLGRNGAGKSTCLRLLAGVLRKTHGRVRIAHHDLDEEPVKARGLIGYLPESAPLYPELRVEEYLRFRAELKGIKKRDREMGLESVLNQVDALDLRRVRCAQLSRGYQKRVSLADVLLTQPEVLLLDEPTAGLDPTQNLATRQLIQSLGQSHTVIVSTHILSEIESMCGSVLLIDQGKLIFDGSLASLYALRNTTELVVTIRTDADTINRIASSLPGLVRQSSAEENLYRLEFTVEKSHELDQFTDFINRRLIEEGVKVREITRKTASIEQIFTALTEQAPPR
jgi:ABC-2 type transport system ATP-binding protein